MDKEKRGLFVVLGFLSIVVVILAVANIAIFVQVGNNESQEIADNVDEQSGSGGDETQVPSGEDQPEIPGLEWRVDATGKTFDEVVMEYQALIDAAENDYVRFVLYDERITYVFSRDDWLEHGDLLMSDAIAIDDILKSVNSAVKAVNIASSVGNKEMIDKYNLIITERSGFNSDEYLTIEVGSNGGNQ